MRRSWAKNHFEITDIAKEIEKNPAKAKRSKLQDNHEIYSGPVGEKHSEWPQQARSSVNEDQKSAN